jgi:threonyl-tRNA synthetase
MTELERIRHSAAHVLATAILRIWPEAQFAAGPPVDTGFYYDVDLPHRITPEDFSRIEEEMKREIKANLPFERVGISRSDALAMAERGELASLAPRNTASRFKLDILQNIPEGETITIYRNGEFTDLCAGPHVMRTGNIGAFKLTHVASAYYKGDENNPQLQRIYGTAFKNKTEMEKYFTMLEEAKKRDHRKIGREQQLFHIDESVGQGLILWTPKGSIIRQELQDFIGGELRKQGYSQVFTPHIGRLGLYQTSGHFPYYAESQFPPLIDRETLADLSAEGCSCADLSNRVTAGEIDGYLLKPMNCPMHIKIFDSQPRSYRDLPVRLAEFGTVYRWEQSGELNGLTRVRGFTQDDAHLFCTEEQVSSEILGCLALVRTVLSTLGMTDYRVRVGLRDPDSNKYTGDPANWDKAETACREAAKTLDVPFTEEPGEAAFYGKSHVPVMIHRAPFGSMERFTGVLIEHFAGNFPLWLSPEQVRVLPINDDPVVIEYCDAIVASLRGEGVRCERDTSPDSVNAKIAKAEQQKVHTMFVVGKRDVEAGNVSLRVHGKGNLGAKNKDEVMAEIVSAIRTRQA